MKHFLQSKKTLNIFTLLFLVNILLFASSCGTIGGAITGGKRPSFIVNAPSDVVVKLNGEVQNISSEVHASNTAGKGTVDYYTAAVKIPYKHPVTLEISSYRLGKTGTVNLKPKSSTLIFIGNLLICPLAGHILDAVTKNNKTLRPKYIDVASVLNNIPLNKWPSQAKLKNIEKKRAK